jgi:mono/diheme cytochrome c family protein
MKVTWIGVSILAVATVWMPESSHSQTPQYEQYWYFLYCASCHGKTGKGDGVVAKSLLKTPADLTKLSEVNGGKFPSELVYDTIIGGKEVEAHGTKEMPAWGFPRAVEDSTPEIVRIRAIVHYISTLQGN